MYTRDGKVLSAFGEGGLALRKSVGNEFYCELAPTKRERKLVNFDLAARKHVRKNFLCP